ncbi:Abi family protein [Kocuria sp. ZOR0020]|uniref:Abi family protein n=1 Tax=Kocuria sp. ZOR0020 TaxID=1339234 RepID=UPI00064670D8|nr:Abi family protein [Kocuria sp. ZOR0020]
MVQYSPERVCEQLSAQRLGPYADRSHGELEEALKLYTWSTQMSAAAFETVAHLEVLLRNAIDRELALYFKENTRAIPWFLSRPPMNDETSVAIQTVRQRLRNENRDTRHQIIAGLSFGFWAGMLGAKYEELWRACLHKAFPNSSGIRKDVAREVEAVRKFRNRLAHHDSTLNVDIPFEMRRVMRLAEFISLDAARWLEDVGRHSDVYTQRPDTGSDTVIVPAKHAWDLYLSDFAYVCQAGRSFRPIDRIAFYSHREIKSEVPRILHRVDDVPWTDEYAAQLDKSEIRYDRQIAKVIRASRNTFWKAGTYQVFLLSRRGDPEHRALHQPIPHKNKGRGSAFVQKQRYTSLHALETATSTDELT